MTIPTLPSTSSKILLAIGLLLVFVSCSLMHSTYMDASYSMVKMDSLLEEAEYLTPIIDTEMSQATKLVDGSVLVDKRGEFQDSIFRHIDSLQRASRRLIVELKINKAKCDVYKMPLEISVFLACMGGILTCIGFTAVVFDEHQEIKQKHKKRYY